MMTCDDDTLGESEEVRRRMNARTNLVGMGMVASFLSLCVQTKRNLYTIYVYKTNKLQVWM